ncbi:MAG: DUF4266 domain-containing protein [Candidatus Hydrogenedentota bacterium]|nr:MAG: DUF4266 domain-containing protein [Candidatus Hydrogenedentota bacterium]
MQKIKIAIFLFSALTLLNCQSVKPYERQYLSQPGMKEDPLSLRSRYESHWRSTVEAQDLSTSLAGGGCACK